MMHGHMNLKVMDIGANCPSSDISKHITRLI